MTRLEQAKKWWNKNVDSEEWVPHKQIPRRHLRVLYRAGLLHYKYSHLTFSMNAKKNVADPEFKEIM